MRTADDQRRILSKALRSWGNRRRALDTERDPLILASLEAGITKEEVHQSTGLGRTTIDRIEKTKEETS